MHATEWRNHGFFGLAFAEKISGARNCLPI